MTHWKDRGKIHSSQEHHIPERVCLGIVGDVLLNLTYKKLGKYSQEIDFFLGHPLSEGGAERSLLEEGPGAVDRAC